MKFENFEIAEKIFNRIKQIKRQLLALGADNLTVRVINGIDPVVSINIMDCYDGHCVEFTDAFIVALKDHYTAELRKLTDELEKL